jgi:hypothetical protein
VVLFGWHVVLHGGVADLCDGQLPTEATLVKGHSFGAVAIKKKKGCEIHPIVPLNHSALFELNYSLANFWPSPDKSIITGQFFESHP